MHCGTQHSLYRRDCHRPFKSSASSPFTLSTCAVYLRKLCTWEMEGKETHIQWTVSTETSFWSTETSAKPPKTTKYMEVTIRKAFIIRSVSAGTVLSLWTWQAQRHKTTSAYLFYYVYFPPICYISELALLLLIESCILNNSIKLHIFHPTQCRPLSKPQRLFCSSHSLVQYAKYSCQSASILDSIIAKQNVKNMRRVRTKKRYQQHSSLHTSVLI